MINNDIILVQDKTADSDLVSLAEEKLHIKAVTEMPEDSNEKVSGNGRAMNNRPKSLDEKALGNVSAADESTDAMPILAIDSDGISLIAGNQKIRGDFSKEIPRITNESRLNGELLIKAAKVKKRDHELTAIDATAGLGEDALLLAAYGYTVTMYERDPVIGLLLYDALRRAREIPELCDIVSRMTLKMEDSIVAMQDFVNNDNVPATVSSQEEQDTITCPDIILLDPMFPKRKKSGLIKKKFQVLHYLEKPCTDETELLAAAKAAHPKKIIIKRPAKGPFLADEKPSYSIKGDSIRYDCITLN